MKGSFTYIIAILSACVFFSRCNSDDQKPKVEEGNLCENNQDIVITTTNVCGWFPNYDSIAIDAKGIRHYNYCLKNKPAEEYSLSCEEWDALLSKLHIQKFNDLDLTTCNRCFDGCDVSFAVQTKNTYHRIVFWPGYNDTPAEIKDFVDEIQRLRTTLVTSTCI